MSLIYPLIAIRQIVYYLMERYSSIELRQSLIKMCFFLLLSLFTTIVINILLPIFILKMSPLLISSSSPFSLLIPSHILHSSDITSLQYFCEQHHDLQTDYQRQDILEKT
ncbi:unnamed protein product, partial [Rotaria magnacalcarata]